MILVLDEGLSIEQISVIERAVRAAGGDPKRLAAGDRLAIDARGADGAMLARPPGVAFVLDAAASRPKVARIAGEGTSVVTIGKTRVGGGDLVVIAGPCAVESREQLQACATAVVAGGGSLLRGGAFKPRTSPYSFQGLGEQALVLLRDIADSHGLGVVTEVMEPGLVGLVSEYADALQIGSRNAQNFPLLKAVGKQSRPVVLKRGMAMTLDEWLLAAEYVAEAGNPNVILCERGVRSFDPAARNLLDLAAVPLLRERTRLPILVDPSHGVGVRSAIPATARAAVAAGADGVMIEIHPSPGEARSDGFQAIPCDEFAAVTRPLFRIAEVLRGLGASRARGLFSRARSLGPDGGGRAKPETGRAGREAATLGGAMAIRKIATIGHPVLRQPARAVSAAELATPAMQTFIDDLIETMRDANGAGIAANQVYEPVQVCTIEVKDNPRYPYKPNIPLTVLVNPVLTPLNNEMFDNYEGCLSVPNLRGMVSRHTEVRVQAMNRLGEAVDFIARGISAGTYQHEVDHLHGRLFVDAVRDTTTLTTWADFERYHQAAFVEHAKAIVARFGS